MQTKINLRLEFVSRFFLGLRVLCFGRRSLCIMVLWHLSACSPFLLALLLYLSLLVRLSYRFDSHILNMNNVSINLFHCVVLRFALGDHSLSFSETFYYSSVAVCRSPSLASRNGRIDNSVSHCVHLMGGCDTERGDFDVIARSLSCADPPWQVCNEYNRG